MRIFCNHEWEEVVNMVLPSAYEQMEDVKSFKVSKTWPEYQMLPFMKKSIVILACTKCGKLYKSIETNP